jgi:hypothetical protein
MWDHGEEATKKLLAMSRATVKRRVGMFLKARRKCRGLSDTKPSHLKHLVPIFTGPWRDKPPGYGQVDTVRHANTAFGDAVYTAQYTDAATLTTIPRAQWNKGDVATRGSLQAIQTRLPFPWLGAHPDTGSEFINHMVVQWCAEQKIELTRSRPNHKNDNMYIEERNGHVVRKVVGYLDLNCIEAVEALNRVYDVLTPYLFHFMAVRRMTGKERVQSKYKRTYEKTAMTPYARVLAHPTTTEDMKRQLQEAHTTLNPKVLKEEMDRCIRELYAVQKQYGTRKAG